MRATSPMKPCPPAQNWPTTPSFVTLGSPALAAVKVKCVESVTVIGPKFELSYAAAANGVQLRDRRLAAVAQAVGAAVATLIVVPLSEIELILTGVPATPLSTHSLPARSTWPACVS